MFYNEQTPGIDRANLFLTEKVCRMPTVPAALKGFCKEGVETADMGHSSCSSSRQVLLVATNGVCGSVFALWVTAISASSLASGSRPSQSAQRKSKRR